MANTCLAALLCFTIFSVHLSSSQLLDLLNLFTKSSSIIPSPLKNLDFPTIPSVPSIPQISSIPTIPLTPAAPASPCSDPYAHAQNCDVCRAGYVMTGTGCQACKTMNLMPSTLSIPLNSLNPLNPPECRPVCPKETPLAKNGACVSACDTGYFRAKGFSLCFPCADNCARCTAENTCTKCNEGYLLQDGKCVEACDRNHYLDDYGVNCLTCGNNCKKCPGALRCVNCVRGVLISGQPCDLIDNLFNGF